MKTFRLLVLPLLGALSLAGCDLDLIDPNNPTEDAAVSTPTGVRQIAIGLQATYSNGFVGPVYTVGLATDELGAGSATFDSYQRTEAGDEMTGGDGPANDTWFAMYDVVRVADVLIESADNVGFSDSYVSGLLALAKFYKGMAFAQIAQIYPSAPIAVGATLPDPAFVTQEEVLAHALDLLMEARDHMAASPPPEEFFTQVVAPSFDLENSIQAMIARYSLIAGNHADALTAANAVDLTVLSEFEFDALDSNPLWNLWYASGNAYEMRPLDAWRLDAEAGDQRVDYWVEAADITGALSPLDEVIRYDERTESFPVYVPDEMRLIRAEIYARDGGGDALAEINAVRTPCASALDVPVACLPALTVADVPTDAELLAAILMERRYELFLQAVRWSDLRRFAEPLKFDFMPIPNAECGRNASAPDALCPNNE